MLSKARGSQLFVQSSEFDLSMCYLSVEFIETYIPARNRGAKVAESVDCCHVGEIGEMGLSGGKARG